jgi:hypothetical protein
MHQTQTKKGTEEFRKSKRSYALDYRERQTKGFNLLKKYVPGIEHLNHPDVLTETARYIKELENEIKEVKKELLKKKVNYIKGLEDKIKELETSQTEMDTDNTAQPLMPADLGTGLCSLMAAYISEPNSPTDISEPEMVGIWERMTDIWEPEMVEESFATTGGSEAISVLSTPTFTPVKKFTLMETGGSEDARETSSPMVTTSEESVSHEEELSPDEEELLESPEEEELLESPEEEEELPEFNTVDDLRQWLGLCSPSEEIPESVSPEEKIPEFNSVEDLKQWLGL